MALFDPSYFSSSTFNGQGSGLFDLIRSLAAEQGAYNPNSAGFGASPTDVSAAAKPQTPDYGQTSNMQIGNYQMPVFGQPDPNSAAIPPNAQPAMGIAPQPPQANDGPDFSQRLTAGLQGLSSIPQSGLLGGLFNAGRGLATGTAPQNPHEQVLVQRGIDPQLAKIIARDPALMHAVIPQLAGTKDQTEAIKNYNLYAAQEKAAGRQPIAFFDYEKELKSTGATRVNQVNQAENSYDKAMGQSFAKKYDTLNEAGSKADSTLATVGRMRQAMNDPNFYSGRGAEMFALPIKQAIAAFGGDPKSAASLEEFRALASKQILDGLGGSLGTGISNADRDFISATVANLGNTKEGNAALLNIAEKQARRQIEIAGRAQAYVESRGRLDAGFDRELAAWKQANPLFTAQEKQAITAAQGAAPATAPAVPVKRYNPKTGKMESVQ